MTDFSQIMKDGIKSIWELDCEEQSSFLNVIAEIRGMKNPEILREIGGFFVPNEEYMALRFGSVIKGWSFDCYLDDDLCKWSNCFVLPIFDVGNAIVGLCGFNPFRYAEAKETGNKSIGYYYYSSGIVFKKGRHVYAQKNAIQRAIEDGYVMIVDGVFDAVSLTDAGFNAWALMGSSLTQEIIVLMRFVKRVILIADNDDAGIKLRETLKCRIRNLEIVTQDYSKDIDDVLKSEFRDSVVAQLRNLISRNPLSITKVLTKRPRDLKMRKYTNLMV